MYFVRLHGPGNSGRVRFENGFTSYKKLLQKYSPEDISFVRPAWMYFYLFLFSLPVVAMIFFIFFHFNSI